MFVDDPDLLGARHTLAGLAAGLPTRPGRVTLDLSGPVARLVVDNPSARGAMTLAMMAQLAGAVDELTRWTGAALVLESTDPSSFCAGGHVGELVGALADPAAVLAMSTAMTAVLDALWGLPVVSVAAVRGVCLGGGAELITACDHRIVGADARIRFVQSRLGIAPGWGGARRLATLVGRRHAVRALTAGGEIGPREALAMGLADLVEPDPVPAALDFLAPLIAAAPEAVRACKAQVARAGLARGEEARIFAGLWGGPAHRAALGRLGGSSGGDRP